MIREDYFYSQICHIHCGSKDGTGFLVSPNQIVTAAHVIFDAEEDNKPVQIKFEPGENPCEYTLWKSNIRSIQICSFLTLPEPRLFQPLLLRATTDDTEITASTCILWQNAPAPRDSYSLKYRAVSNWFPEYGYKANIALEPGANGLSTYSGFSGAPVIVGNCIDGLLTDERLDCQKSVRVYGIVGIAFQNILKEANIPFLLHKENPVSPCLFTPTKYGEYLQDCLDKSSLFPLEIQEYVQDWPLFTALESFVYDKWSRRFLANFTHDNNTHKLLEQFIDEIGNYL